MTTVLIRFRVADYDAWRKGYDSDLVGPLGADVRSNRIWRGQDDPNLVTLEETFESREVADSAVNHPAVQEAMVRDGIDPSSVQLDFFDEVGRWTR